MVEFVWDMHIYLGHACNLFGTCMQFIWDMHAIYFGIYCRSVAVWYEKSIGSRKAGRMTWSAPLIKHSPEQKGQESGNEAATSLSSTPTEKKKMSTKMRRFITASAAVGLVSYLALLGSYLYYDMENMERNNNEYQKAALGSAEIDKVLGQPRHPRCLGATLGPIEEQPFEDWTV
eukprot:GHVP01013497.1.p1 GENE.GHVP01013497.1~~GHVP01013497.1.p1  ORF type:complete len:175 (-),score=23.18 GHVP01013497.1:133-657(-)